MVRHHSVSVPVSAGVQGGKTRYTIAFYQDGLRKRRVFTDLDAAKREAKQVAEKILRGMQFQNDLRPAEREAFLAAQRILKEIDERGTLAVHQGRGDTDRLPIFTIGAACRPPSRRDGLPPFPGKAISLAPLREGRG